MYIPLLITLQNGEEIIINENQVVSVKNHEGDALVRMSNRDEHRCTSPRYDEWYNDVLVKKE